MEKDLLSHIGTIIGDGCSSCMLSVYDDEEEETTCKLVEYNENEKFTIARKDMQHSDFYRLLNCPFRKHLPIIKKDMKIECAPTTALKFVKEIEDEFTEKVICAVLYDEDDEDGGVLITDESLLSDFCSMFEESEAVGDGATPGTKRFEFYEGENKVFTDAIPEPDTMPQFIQKCQEVFGVDITPVKGEYLPVIFKYIAENRK